MKKVRTYDNESDTVDFFESLDGAPDGFYIKTSLNDGGIRRPVHLGCFDTEEKAAAQAYRNETITMKRGKMEIGIHKSLKGLPRDKYYLKANTADPGKPERIRYFGPYNGVEHANRWAKGKNDEIIYKG